MSPNPEEKLGSPTRRRFVLGSGMLIAGMVGGSYLALDELQPALKQWLRFFLQRQLPQLTLTDESAALLAKTVDARKWLGGGRARIGIRLSMYSPWAIRFIPGVNTALERLERSVLTEFLLGSGFFLAGCQQAGTLEYQPTDASCLNPFACFREGTDGVGTPATQSSVCER